MARCRSRPPAGHLWEALSTACDVLGFGYAADGDEVRHLALARIIEPTSKLDQLRVLEEAGIASVSYRTVKRRLLRWGFPGAAGGGFASPPAINPYIQAWSIG